ncbi:MAG: 5'-nucleotidase C-terminal domain-containing protein [Eubacteriales bacterium]|nr:5'-nucleotidase C-terminal domain-containing protein [Eubacteriales bacterium]
MKKALALILSLAMILCLVPAVASADTASAMTAAPADGDKVVIFAPAYNVALGGFETAATYYNEGVNITLTEGAMADVPANVVWDVTVNEDSTYTFSQNGDKLAMGASYSSTPKNEVNDKWTLTAVTGGYYIENVGRTNSAGDSHYKLEWYATNTTPYFSGYHTVAEGSEGMFTFVFYKVEGAPATDTPEPPSDTPEPPSDTPEPPVDTPEPPVDTPEPPSDTPEPPADKNDEDLVILYSNDVHCGIGTEVKDADGKVTGYTGGYAAVAAAKKAAEADFENVLLVDAGDAIQGGPIGTLSTGSYIVDIMNFVGYDISAVGNHEFDYGMDRFFELNTLANYDYISSNFVELATGAAVLDAYKIVNFGDKKVAFVGISTPETFTKSTPTFFQNADGTWKYGFSHDDLDTMAANVQASIDAAKTAGADYVIALGHMGIDSSSSPWTSKELIAKVSGLSAFIDGHSHSVDASELVADKDGKDVTLTQTGTKLANLGKMILKADGTITCELMPLAEAAVDAATSDELVRINNLYADLLATVVAHSDYLLTVQNPDGTARAVRSAETNLGDLCADAYRDQMDADIAFVNGGGVRASIPAGDITYNQILTVHPFGNMACLVEVTGQQILDALEWGARFAGTGENGGFLQVSGISFKVNTLFANGCQADAAGIWTGHTGDYRVHDVMVGEEALDLAKTYTLASHNYMLKSQGDGFGMFGTANVTILRDEVLIDNQVLINYIQNTLEGEIPQAYANLAGQGRITIGEFYDYALTGDEGYEADYSFDEDGNLLWTAKLSDLAGLRISSLQFIVGWDNTKLDLIGTESAELFYMSQGKEKLADISESVTDASDAVQEWPNFAPNGCFYNYAVGSSYGLQIPGDGTTVVTLKFKVKEGVEDNTKLDIAITGLKMTLVNASEEAVDLTGKLIFTFDGYIITGAKPIDKAALIAEDAKDDALMVGVVASTSGTNLTAGTKWLTSAEIAANTAALAAAQAVIDNAEATQAEVDAALAALIAAFVAPKTATVDKTALESAIEAAQAALAAEALLDETGEGVHSDKWVAAVEAALAAAQAELEAEASTQDSVDTATEALLNALNKTGEEMTVVVFAGMMILAMMGLALVVRRRFN